MLILSRANINKSTIIKYKAIILNSTFLSIYGLPFCIFYNQMLQNDSSSLIVALEASNLLGTASLAIMSNFPNLIVNQTIISELSIIKNNCTSLTKLFNSLQDFRDYVFSNIALKA